MERLDRGQSVLITGDRRMGKTSVARLVEHHMRDAGHRVIRMSAERASLDDFVEALANELDRVTPGGAVRREMSRWTVKLTGGPVEAERSPGTRPLDDIVRTAVEASDASPLVLIIDEVAVLAKQLERRNPGSGGELLIALRRIRQTHPGRLAMLLLGSIGFHHVDDTAPGSLNDVEKVGIEPLSDADATYLARCLLLGEDVRCADDRLVAERIATAAERVPFYVHHLVASAANRVGSLGPSMRPDDVEMIVAAALEDPDDPWEMRHYRRRLADYYGAAHVDEVSDVIDAFASAREPLTLDQLVSALGPASAASSMSRRSLIALLEKLEQDHYLRRHDATSAFRSEIVRRAWIQGNR